MEWSGSHEVHSYVIDSTSDCINVLGAAGNAFIVNVALADLLVTGLVFPASCVVILAGMRDQDLEQACNFHWMVAVLCCLVTMLTFMFMAVENLTRLCMPPSWYEHVTPAKITVLMCFIWIVSGVVVGLQSALPLGPDYCHRKYVTLQKNIGLNYCKLFKRVSQLYGHNNNTTTVPPTLRAWGEYNLVQ